MAVSLHPVPCPGLRATLLGLPNCLEKLENQLRHVLVRVVSECVGDLFTDPWGLHRVKEEGREGDQRVEFISIFWEHRLMFLALGKLSNNNISLQLTWEGGPRSCSLTIRG